MRATPLTPCHSCYVISEGASTLAQDPTPHQTDISSVIQPDEMDHAVAHTNGNGTKTVTRAKAVASNGHKSARSAGAPGLKIERRYTKPGEDVYATVEWELRDAVISNERGEKVFEQRDVEIPALGRSSLPTSSSRSTFEGISARQNVSEAFANSLGASPTQWQTGGGRWTISPPKRTRRRSKTN